MPFEIFHRARIRGPRIALFPGAWNPPTNAHLAIAQAARTLADEIVWVLPRELPHKTFHGAPFPGRLNMLKQLAVASPDFSVATSTGGLYIDIAKEARIALEATSEIHLVCGRDAADRIASWDYGRPGVFEEMLLDFPLLVAARAGHFAVAERHRNRILPLTMDSSFNHVSSSEVRARIAAGTEWHHLVPGLLHSTVAQLYS